MEKRQYKITVREYVESPDAAPGTWEEKTYLLTAREVESFASLNQQFVIETVEEWKESSQ